MGTRPIHKNKGDVVGMGEMNDCENIERDRGLESPQIQEFFKDRTKKLGKNKRVLELGCGRGRVLEELQEKYGFSEYYGVDKEDVMLIDRKRYIHFVQKKITDISLKDFNNKRFDFIFSFRTFLYLTSNEKLETIEKIYNELLNLGGEALIDFCGTIDNENVLIKISENNRELIVLLLENVNFGIELINKEYPIDYEKAREDGLDPEREREIKRILQSDLAFKSYTVKITKKSNEQLKLTQK